MGCTAGPVRDMISVGRISALNHAWLTVTSFQWSWALGEGGRVARTWRSMPREMAVGGLPHTVAALLQGISHGVVVHIHAEVAICVMS